MKRGIAVSFLCAVLFSAPLAAQIDTTILKATQGGFTVEFENQPLVAVINALALAGNLNLQMPGTLQGNPRHTLRLNNPISKDDIPGLIQSLATQYGLLYSNEGGLIQITQPARGGGAGRGPTTPQVAPTDMVFKVLSLNHLNNQTVAQILMALWTSGGRGVNINNLLNQNQGRGNQGRAGGAAGGGGGGGRGGGRGGGGGGDDEQSLEELVAIINQQLALDPGAALAANVDPDLAQVTTQDVRTILQQAQGRGGGGRGGGDAQPAQQILQQLGGAAALLQGAAQGAAAAQQQNPTIVPTGGTNQLIVRASAADLEVIEALIQAVDLRPLQVLIEVSIVEVRRTDDLNVGISGGGNYTKQGDEDPRVSTTLLRPSTFDNARDFVLQLTGGRGTVDFNVALNALAIRGDVKVISNPILFAQNNLQAQLIVGEQRPFVQTTQLVPNDNGVVNQVVQYRDVATTLLITPTINADGYVNMDVNQTVQDVTSEVQFDAPVISTRQALTSLFVKDGQTAVIGGLTSTRTDKTRTGIPFLSRIPIIGALFGATRNSDVNTEMYLFLTPHVVTLDQDMDRMRESVKAGSELLRNTPLKQIVQPDPTIKVVIPPDTVQASRVPQRLDSLGRRVLPPADSAGRRIPPPKTGESRPLASAHFSGGSFGSNKGVLRQ